MFNCFRDIRFRNLEPDYQSLLVKLLVIQSYLKTRLQKVDNVNKAYQL